MKTVRFLFNDEMAHAIVEGRKTVTRRPMKVQPAGVEWWLHGAPSTPDVGVPSFRDANGKGWLLCGPFMPPCAPGDILIGRECWGSGDLYYHDHETDPPGVIVYRADKSGRYADDTPLPKRDTDSFNWSMQKWRPSIHMPDWAARIRRRVIGVTVERLRDITENDARREGSLDPGDGTGTWRGNFAGMWDAIYYANGLGWAVNPWVWRIEFSAENVQEVSGGR